ncbi:MAG: capsule assembly Wzi family protein [Candidatus Kryptoniota bacterium]
MKFKVLTLVIIFVVSSPVVFAQHNYSIPADNWTYEVISQLQTRGYLLDLSPGFKPYRRMEVARALLKLEQTNDVSAFPLADRWLIEKLEREFSYELRLLKLRAQHTDTSLTGARFAEEAFFNVVKGYYKDFKYAGSVSVRPISRTEFGFDIGNHLSLYTDATVDQTLIDDSLYTGSTKFGLKALHQQAYIQYSDSHVDLTFGRDYLSWGYGNHGTVLISTTPGAFDMVSLFLKTKVVKYNWFVAQLDQMPEFTPDTNSYMPFPTVGVPNPAANRYFTGSRFEFNIANKVFLGAYQAATFGGVNAPIDLEIINPVRVTYETESNSHKDLNAFLGGDISVFLLRKLNFYGDLMIDDWQVDRKTKGDLKPNLYAFDVGLKASNILEHFGTSGTDANVQLMVVRNRVYNEYNWSSFEKLLLRNYPVANPYGDNFWNLDIRASHWLNYDWKVGLQFLHVEHGSSNIYSSYSMPWLTDPNVTVQTGYHEAFPYGTIQVTNLVSARLLYQPASDIYGELMIGYSLDHNYRYTPGLDKNIISFLFTFYYNFTKSILFR